MANIKLQEKLMAVADAIREKTGKSEKMTLAEMPVEIGNIQSGGGGSAARGYEVDDVTFYDYDGTIVYSCSMEEAQKLEKLPTPPEHKGLVFQEWNWTLEEIKSSSVGADVGALYDTEDGALVFNIEVKNEIERKNIALKFIPITSSIQPPHLTVDWGDGSTETTADTVSSSGLVITHAYSQNGRYAIHVKKSAPDEEGFSITCVDANSLQLISDGSNIDNIIDSVYVGSDCDSLQNKLFAGVNAIRSLTVHKDLKLPNTAPLFSQTGGALRCLILPPNTVNLYGIITGCKTIIVISIPPWIVSCSLGKDHSCSRVIVPDTASVLGSSSSCGSKIKELRIGKNVWKIDSYAFATDEKCISNVTIPASVKMLNSSCFSGLKNIKEYHLLGETPPNLASAKSLATVTGVTKIFVPKGTGDVYRAATNWAALADYIIEEGK